VNVTETIDGEGDDGEEGDIAGARSES